MSNKSTLVRLSELARLFFKLGIISFGGPAAHIAMMEDEVVNRRQWITRSHFLDLVGATNLIPGPNSTEMAIHIGFIYAGWLGLIVAGVCFIFPAALITASLAWVYLTLGKLPLVTSLLYGIKPAVLGVILNAVWKLGKSAIKTRQLLIISLAVATLSLLGINEVLAILMGGLIGMIWLCSNNKGNPPQEQTATIIATGLTTGAVEILQDKPVTIAAATSAIASSANVPLWQLGWFFFKVGSVLFGGGYVLVAFLEGGLVEEHGWLTQQQLLDAIAIGQFTPGPVLSTATFIGYLISGIPGAIVATVAIFLPSFFFVAALNPFIPRLRRSQWTSAFLDAVNASAVALMAVVMLQLAVSTLIMPKIDWVASAIALVAGVLAIRFRVNAAWLVLGSALVGLVFKTVLSFG